MIEAAPAAPELPDGSLSGLVAAAGEYHRARRSEATRDAYERDWATFCTWCAARNFDPLPADVATLVLYVTDLAGRCSPSTIGRQLAAIAAEHRDARVESATGHPAVADVMSGIRRTHGSAPHRQVAPALTADVRRMVEAMPDSLIGTRDRALLLVGFAGAFRRSELVAIDVEDLAETDDGLVVSQRRSKTDQEGQGRRVGLPYGSNPATCPVRSVEAWREASGVEAGALWRSVTRHGHLGAGRLTPAAVALVVKRSAERAGLDPAKYSGHSLRAGFATAAAQAGASERSIQAQTGHRSLTVLRGYIRDGSLFRENAATMLGL